MGYRLLYLTCVVAFAVVIGLNIYAIENVDWFKTDTDNIYVKYGLQKYKSCASDDSNCYTDDLDSDSDFYKAGLCALILLAIATVVAGLAAFMSLIKVFKRHHLGRKKRIMQAAALLLLLMAATIISYPLWTKDDREDLPVDTKWSTGYIIACVSTGVSLVAWGFLAFRVFA
mmetsp:Transcript_17607/g.24443  ORF Transcript_17607/g.24443 Transcript_17607/m.24443 type:complete len:172 (-) Transcript_17607:80-595(-)